MTHQAVLDCGWGEQGDRNIPGRPSDLQAGREVDLARAGHANPAIKATMGGLRVRSASTANRR